MFLHSPPTILRGLLFDLTRPRNRITMVQRAILTPDFNVSKGPICLIFWPWNHNKIRPIENHWKSVDKFYCDLLLFLWATKINIKETHSRRSFFKEISIRIFNCETLSIFAIIWKSNSMLLRWFKGMDFRCNYFNLWHITFKRCTSRCFVSLTIPLFNAIILIATGSIFNFVPRPRNGQISWYGMAKPNIEPSLNLSLNRFCWHSVLGSRFTASSHAMFASLAVVHY